MQYQEAATAEHIERLCSILNPYSAGATLDTSKVDPRTVRVYFASRTGTAILCPLVCRWDDVTFPPLSFQTIEAGL